MATTKELLAAIDRFYSDTSRSQQDTREGLREAIDHAEMLISTLDRSGDSDQG